MHIAVVTARQFGRSAFALLTAFALMASPLLTGVAWAVPTVSITSPTAGATVSGTSVTVTANAIPDAGQTITQVQFFVDGSSIGTDTNSAGGWSTSWNTTTYSNGSHNLTAVATDDLPATGSISTPVSVTVNNVAANTGPTNVNAGSDRTITLPAGTSLSGSATDDGLPNPPGALTYSWSRFSGPTGGTVNFSSPNNASTNATFSTAGTYTIRLTVSDSALSASDDVIVTVNDTPPTVSITSPSNNATVSGTITITASASDNVGVNQVQFYDGATLIGTDTTTPYSISWNTSTVSSGSHTLTARATDTGNQTTTSSGVTVVINGAPVVDAGPNVAGKAGVTVSLNGTVTDDGLPSPSSVSTTWTRISGPTGGTVTFGNASAVDTTATFSIAGDYLLRLTANDGALSASDDAQITVAANAKPTVKVTAPAGTGLISGPLTVRIQATDAESAAGTLVVQYRIDGAGATLRTATYNTFTKLYEGTIDTKTLTDGSHSVTAQAKDGFGNTTVSSSVTFVVDNNEPPTVRISSPVTNTTVTGSVVIKATATDDKAVVRVEFFLDGVRIGTDSNSSGGWTFTWDSTKATSGPHTITATAFDLPGKKGSGGVFVTVDQPPSINITSPRSRAVIKERVTISTTAKDDIKINRVEFFVDGVSIGADTNPSAGWSISWNTRDVDNGRRTIRAVVTDSNNQTKLDSIEVTVDNDLAPRVTITSPRDGATIYGVGIVQISANASDVEGVNQVEFFVDGTSIGVDDIGSNGWSAVWNAVRATIGSHTIRAVATDTLRQTAADTNNVTIQAFTTPSTAAPTSTTAPTIVVVDTPAEGLSATTFSLAPDTVAPGGEIALTVALAADIPGKADVQFLLDGEPLGEVATVNAVDASAAAYAAAVFTRTLPSGMQIGLHRVEAATTDQPPQVLASRTVGVIAGETSQSDEPTSQSAGPDGTPAGSSTPIGLILAFAVGGIAAVVAAGFGAAGWYRRKMIVRRLAARGR